MKHLVNKYIVKYKNNSYLNKMNKKNKYIVKYKNNYCLNKINFKKINIQVK